MRGRIVCLLSWAAAWGADADLILHNAKVITVDARFSVKQAVAIKAGRIVAVGGDGEVLGKEKGPRTKVIDLQGKAMLPGLIDAHVHALDSGLSEFRAPLPPLNSIADIQNYVRMKAKSTPKGGWIMGARQQSDA